MSGMLFIHVLQSPSVLLCYRSTIVLQCNRRGTLRPDLSNYSIISLFGVVSAGNETFSSFNVCVLFILGHF